MLVRMIMIYYVTLGLAGLLCTEGAAPNAGYITLKNLGCWRDGGFRLVPSLEGKSHHLDGDYAVRGNAIEKCARAAWERGYRAFVLQNGGWCGSSSTAIFKYSRLGKAEECGSLGKGGFRANQVYEIKAYSQPHRARGPSRLKPSFIFEDGSQVNTENDDGGSYEFILSDLGCWTLPGNGVRSMEGLMEELDGHYRSRVQAITKCARGLAELGYRTMAMHDGGKCLVVDNITAVAVATRRKPLCSHTGEGTSSSIQVYEIRYSETRYPPPPLSTSSTTSTTSTTTTTTPSPSTSTLPWVVDPVVVTRTMSWQRTSPPRSWVPSRQPVTQSTVASTTRRFVTQPRFTSTTPVIRSNEPSPEYFFLTDMGCWSYVWNYSLPSLEGSSHELDGHYSQRSDAIRKCAKVAAQLGYDVFAIQDGGRCASSPNARQTFASHGRSSYCRRDGTGGSWANQIYEVNTVWEVRISSIGCYRAGSPNVMESLEETSAVLNGPYYRRNDAIRKCARVAAARGLDIFSLHDDGECFSSADARARYPSNGISSACPMNGRGGLGANQVYEIVGADKIRIQSLGCWKDTLNRAVPGLEQTDGDLMDNFRVRENAISKCAVVAWRTGLKVFVLQDGGWCGGSVLAEATYMKYGPSSGCKSDGEGGRRANQVYEIIDE